MRLILLVSVLTCAFFLHASSQRTCIIKEETTNATVMTVPASGAAVPDVVIIPVVVHVLYNTPDQNISNEQIRSQIKVLNEDFRKKNRDAAYVPSAFKNLAADSHIEFRLATKDPSGLSTNGIVRKSTSVTAFSLDDNIKSSIDGGDNPWNRDEYLNLWVGNLSGGVMGYASAPGSAPETDGVVIKYTAFGSTPNLKSPYNKGRTTVHEVGHWLGLRHIWGDADCGDDKIDDTPPQSGPTRGCPSGVIATCASGAAGNMYMNYMDFTNDECTNMFTLGQAARMRELFLEGGARTALLRSDKAEGAPEDGYVNDDRETGLTMYPNPAVNKLKIVVNGNISNQLIIYNHLGQVVRQVAMPGSTIEINVSSFRNGMYYVSTGGKEIYKFVKAE
jgi:hypothetical protein